MLRKFTLFSVPLFLITFITASGEVPDNDTVPAIGSIQAIGQMGGGEAERKIWWESDPTFSDLSDQASAAASNENTMNNGQHPLGGLVFLKHSSTHSQPAVVAAYYWREARDHLYAKKTDGSVYQDGLITMATPLPAEDWPADVTDARFGDWAAWKLSQHFLNTGLRGLSVADYYDSLIGGGVSVIDFNNLIISDFEQRKNISVSGSTTQQKADFILSNYMNEWTDYWCEAYTNFWSETLRRVHEGSGDDTAFLMQIAYLPTDARSRGVDLRKIQSSLEASSTKRLINVEIQCDHMRALHRYWDEIPRVGMFAAIEPDIHLGGIFNCVPDPDTVSYPTNEQQLGLDSWLRRNEHAADGIRLREMEMLVNGSDAAVGGTATAMGGTATKLFDDDDTSYWEHKNYDDPEYRSTWIQYDFSGSTAHKVTSYRILSNNYVTCMNAGSWQFKGSNDGTNWTTLDTRTNQVFGKKQWKNYSFTNNTAYQIYRLQINRPQKTMTITQRRDVWRKYLKGHFYANGWVHTSDRNGNLKRAISYIQRYYHDKEEIPTDLEAGFRGIIPRHPWGVAGYYSRDIELQHEESGETWDYYSRMESLCYQRVLPAFWASDASIDTLKTENYPTAWVCADTDMMSSAERNKLEAIAPLYDIDDWDNIPSPITFEGNDLTGFAFVNQDNQVVIFAARSASQNQSGADLAITARVHFTIGSGNDGTYTAQDITPSNSKFRYSSGDSFNFTVSNGTGVLEFPLAGFDCRAFTTDLPLLNTTSSSSGVICMEAENYTENVSGTGNYSGLNWGLNPDTDASGDASMVVPNNGVEINGGASLDSPHLDYTFDFAKSGTYFIWVRALTPSGTDDSCSPAYNGTNITQWFMGTSNSWTWKKCSSTFQASEGIQTFSIYMRENGTMIDKIVLTDDSSYDPANVNGGLGPDETISAEGSLIIEAENHDNSSSKFSPFEVYSDSTAGNGEYIRVADSTADNFNGMPDPGYAEYSFTTTESGQVDIWFRAKANNDGENINSNDSFWLDLAGDSSSAISWNSQISSTSWTWYKVYSNTLPAGNYTCKVGYRETGTCLDQLFITTTGDNPTQFLATETL